MAFQIDTSRLKQIVKLERGAHENFEHGACIMEAVSWISDEPWSDRPMCACPVISRFLRSWNDALPDEERTRLLLPLVPKFVGTRGSKELETRRSLMAADWLVRTQTPAWLRLAGLTKQAESLESLPEITSMTHAPSIKLTIEAVHGDARAALAAAWDAARDAALAAAWDAARDAARDAALERLKPTKIELQQSAIKLIDRMVSATDEVTS